MNQRCREFGFLILRPLGGQWPGHNGDFSLKKFGLISVPEVHYRCLTENDLFVVLATDGIWDVFFNKEVADIVAAAPARSHTARILLESAIKAWKRKCPTSKIDDCAVACLFATQIQTTVLLMGEQQFQESSSNLGETREGIGSTTMLDQSKNLLEIDDAATNEDELRALKGVSCTDNFWLFQGLLKYKMIKYQGRNISRKAIYSHFSFLRQSGMRLFFIYSHTVPSVQKVTQLY